ncbi:unnamed protein product, partial [Allacma fusca]
LTESWTYLLSDHLPSFSVWSECVCCRKTGCSNIPARYDTFSESL